MQSFISPAAQARKACLSQHPVKTLSGNEVTVCAQNISLVRIDVQQPGRERKVVLNLFGVKDVENLIAALEAAKATLVADQELLAKFHVAA